MGKASLIFCASNDFMVGVHIVAPLFSSLFVLLIHLLFLEVEISESVSVILVFVHPRGKAVTACTYTHQKL